MRIATKAGILVLCVQLPLRAGAQQYDTGPTDHRPWVRLVVDGTLPLSTERVRRLVGIELGGLLLGPEAGRGDNVTEVWVGRTDGGVQLHLNDPVTGKTMIRALDLSTTDPRVRERLLALSVVEFVTASWIELETTPQPAVPAGGARASGDARQEALRVARKVLRPEQRRAFRVTLAFSWRHFFSTAAGLPGGGLRLTHRPWRHLGWGAEVGLEGAGLPVLPGSVDLVAVSGAAYVLGFIQAGPIRLSGGAGGRLGWVWMAGRPAGSTQSAGRVFAAPWGGPLVRLGGEVELAGRLTGSVGFEACFLTLSARGLSEGQTVVALRGAAVTALFGLGMAF